MKVKFKKSPTGNPFNLAYFTGEVVEIDSNQAQELIDSGFAVEVGKEETNLPSDFPYCEKFAQLGVITMFDVQKLGDLKEIEGFTESMISKVHGYLIAKGVFKEEDIIPEDPCKLPIDFPHREVFAAAEILTLEQVTALAKLTDVTGIGEGKAKDVAEYLKTQKPE